MVGQGTSSQLSHRLPRGGNCARGRVRRQRRHREVPRRRRAAQFFTAMAAIGLQTNVITLKLGPAAAGRRSRTASVLDAALAAARKRPACGSSSRVYGARPTVVHGRGRDAEAVRRLGGARRAHVPAGDAVRDRQRAEPAAVLAAAVRRRGGQASATAFGPVLAAAYDALKAVDPTIAVVGIGLSPRGNDRPVRTRQRLDLARPLPQGARRLVPRERPARSR